MARTTGISGETEPVREDALAEESRVSGVSSFESETMIASSMLCPEGTL